jgi:phosphonate transport system substrate-binding protein
MPRPGILFLLLLLSLQPSIGLAADATSLHVGVFPRRPAIDTQRLFGPLADFLSARLGIPVTLHAPADYPAFWSAVKQGRYDLVHYNQYHYIRAHREFGHRLLVKNEERGRSELRAALYVRTDSPIRRVTELRDGKILFGGDRSAMVSYILATDLLRQSGLAAGDYLESFAQNPPKAITAMYFHQGDAAAAGEAVADLPIVIKAIGGNGVRKLALSRPIPHLPWAVTGDLPQSLQIQLRDALLALNDDVKGRRILQRLSLTGLRPASDGEYDRVREVVAHVLGERF